MLADRVSFEAHLAVRSQNGLDALREFTGSLLAGDSSLVLYESLHAPVSSSAAVGGRLEHDRQLRVATFLRRTMYTNLQLKKVCFFRLLLIIARLNSVKTQLTFSNLWNCHHY